MIQSLPHKLQTLQTQIEKARSPKKKVSLLNQLCSWLLRRDPKQSIQVVEEALEIAQRNNDREGEGMGRVLLGQAMLIKGESLEGKIQAEKGLTLLRASESSLLPRALCRVAMIHSSTLEPQRSIEYLQEAQAIVEEHNDQATLAFILHSLGNTYRSATQYQLALEYLKKSLQLYQSQMKSEDHPMDSLCWSIACTLNHLSQYGEADEYIETGLRIARMRNDRELEGVFLGLRGDILRKVGNYGDALENSLQSIEILRDQPHARQPFSDQLLIVALIYSSLKDYERAFQFASWAQTIVVDHGWHEQLYNVLWVSGEIYEAQMDFDNALGQYRKALALVDSHNLKALRPNCLLLIGDALARQEQNEEAEDYLLLALNEARDYGDNSIESLALISLGEVALRRAEYDEAITMFDGAMTIAREMNATKRLCRALENLGKAYEMRGNDNDYFKALQYLQEARVVQGNLEGLESQTKIRDITVRIETLEKEKEIKRLADQADQHSQKLASTTIHLVEKQELLRSVQRKIQKISKDLSGSPRVHLRALMTELGDNGVNDGNWKELEKTFHLAYDNFIPHVSAQWPDLTPAELKICALLRTGLSTKEMAAFLSVSVAAINKHRNRIRKKIGMKPNENLIKFFTGFYLSLPNGRH